jgi:hypothetical protein
MKRAMFSLISIFFVAIVLLTEEANAVQPLKPPLNLPVKKLVADLIVSNISITPPNPRKEKDMVKIEVTVKNAGTATPSKVCSLSMRVKNEDTHPDYSHDVIPWYANNIPQLAPGAEVKISHVITILYAGQYLLNGVIITEGLQVGEENSQNNRYEKHFTVVGEPAPSDLVIDRLTPTNDHRIKIRLYNQGAPIPDVDFNTSYVRVTVNDTIEKSIHLRDIDPTGLLKPGKPGWGTTGMTYLNYIWPGTGPDGIILEPGHTYKVKVFLDFNRRISETNEVNNIMIVTWGMTP